MSRGRKSPNGAGTIYQRKDGRYEAAMYATTTAGTRRRVRVYGQTWDEVHAKLVQILAQERRGLPIPAANQTVAEYLTYWLDGVVKVHRRPKTYQGYEGVVRLHVIPGLGRKRLARLSGRDVRAWLTQVRTQCQCCKYAWDRDRPPADQCCSAGLCCQSVLSARMVQSVHAVLRNALENAVREELIARNVAKLVQVPSPRYSVGRGLTVEQARTLLNAARADRLHALYVLALLLGLRRAELLGLRWDDVDLVKGTLSITQTLQRVGGELRLVPPKTEHSARTVPLPSLVVAALRDHEQRQHDERGRAPAWVISGFVFTSTLGTPIEPDNLRRSWYPLRQQLGLPVRFHDLRHSCVSLLLDLGVPPHIVREIVGHAHIGITMSVYAHTSLDEKRRALERLGEELE